LDLNANVNIGRRHQRRRTGDDISSSVLRTGELKIRIKQKQYMEMESLGRIFCYDMHVSRLWQMVGKE
jgi:hypothetical protein